MKKVILIFLFIVSCTCVHAQNETAYTTNESAGPVWQEVTSIIGIIQNLEQLKNYKQVKKTIERFVITLGAKGGLTTAQLLTYKNAYDKTKTAFDSFILEVKQDLMSKSRIQDLKRHPATFANKYLTLFNRAVTTYDSELHGLIVNYQAQYQASRDEKGFLRIIQLLFPIANEIVTALTQRRSFDWTKLPMVLNNVNGLFVREYEMKSWDKLLPSQAGLSANENQQTFSNVLESTPTFTDLSGGFSFYQIGKLQDESKARLLLKLYNTADAPNIFSPQRILKTGDQFQIKVSGNAYIYSFSLNSNNKVQLIYPYNKVKFQSRDIGVDTLVYNPLDARMGNSSFMIPKKDPATGRDMYITIKPNADGTMKDDNICIIYSSKEITDLDSFIAGIESATGDISARLSTALKATGAKIELAPKVIYNEATKQYAFASVNEIIPLIIKIKKTAQ